MFSQHVGQVRGLAVGHRNARLGERLAVRVVVALAI